MHCVFYWDHVAPGPCRDVGRSRLRDAAALRQLMQGDDPEALLLQLDGPVRRLSANRPFREELLLMEQIFVLLRLGYRRRVLPGGVIGLVPPTTFVTSEPKGSPDGAPSVQELQRVVEALNKAGMAWIERAEAPPALDFPAAATTKDGG